MKSKSERYVTSRRGWRGGKGNQVKQVMCIAESMRQHPGRTIEHYGADAELREMVEGLLKAEPKKEGGMHQAKIAEIQEQIKIASTAAKHYRNGVLEGGDGYNPYEVKALALWDQLKALQTEQEPDGWTLKATAQRREDWNVWVRGFNGAIPQKVLAAKIVEQGWGPIELKAAIKRHEL